MLQTISKEKLLLRVNVHSKTPVKSNFTKHKVKIAAVCDEKASHCFRRGGTKDISHSSSSSDRDDYGRKKRAKSHHCYEGF